MQARRHILALSDGKAGHAAQAEGVAERLGGTVRRAIVPPRRGLGRLRPATVEAEDGAAPALNWPDLVIACGKAAARPALRFQAGGAKIVFLQKPPVPCDRFDLVAAPAHDRLTGANVVTTLGAPNRVTPDRLADAAAHWRARFDGFPKPWIAALIGGRSKRHRLPPDHAAALGAKIAAAARASGGSVFATASRRTGPEAEAALRSALADTPGWFWDGAGENPYFGLLALVDTVIVTADSVSMPSEAASAGKPALIAALPGGSTRFDRFHAALAAAGHARPFDGGLTRWDPPPLDDAGAVADAIRARILNRK